MYDGGQMSKDQKFGYGFLLVGAGMPYLIDKFFGPVSAAVVSLILLVIGILLLVSAHLHRDRDAPPRGVLYRYLSTAVLALLISSSVGGIIWVMVRHYRGELKSSIAGQAAETGSSDRKSTKKEGEPSSVAKPAVLSALVGSETFNTVVPYIRGQERIIIPRDQNADNPNQEAFNELGDLTQHEGGQYAKNKDETVFLSELLRFRVLLDLEEITCCTQFGMLQTGHGLKGLAKGAIRPPDQEAYSPAKIVKDAPLYEFFNKNSVGFLNSFPIIVPRATKISFPNLAYPGVIGPPKYMIRFERPDYFSIDFSVTPLQCSVGAPEYFRVDPKVEKDCWTCLFVIGTQYKIQRSHKDIDAEAYAKWVKRVFEELQKRLPPA
jgi:hypothetical protein